LWKLGKNSNIFAILNDESPILSNDLSVLKIISLFHIDLQILYSRISCDSNLRNSKLFLTLEKLYFLSTNKVFIRCLKKISDCFALTINLYFSTALFLPFFSFYEAFTSTLRKPFLICDFNNWECVACVFVSTWKVIFSASVCPPNLNRGLAYRCMGWNSVTRCILSLGSSYSKILNEIFSENFMKARQFSCKRKMF